MLSSVLVVFKEMLASPENDNNVQGQKIKMRKSVDANSEFRP